MSKAILAVRGGARFRLLITKITLCSVLILGFVCNHAAKAAEDEFDSFELGDALLELSLEELMNVGIKLGTIAQIKASKLPFTYHLITASDIANAPHRGLYDILAAYVPGLMVMSHANNPKIGIRGIISDRNYKLLLLLNGRNITDKALQGAIAELRMKQYALPGERGKET